MYLQYSFAENDYNKFCLCISNTFKKCLSKQVTKTMNNGPTLKVSTSHHEVAASNSITFNTNYTPNSPN